MLVWVIRATTAMGMVPHRFALMVITTTIPTLAPLMATMVLTGS